MTFRGLSMGSLLAIVAVLPLLAPAISIPRSSSHVEFESSANSSKDTTRPFNAVFYPPLDWAPPLTTNSGSSGINSTVIHSNLTAPHFVSFASTSCSALVPSYPDEFWYEAIDHSNAQSSFLNNKDAYIVWRNVISDFGADNTGNTDSTDAIRNAINHGGNGLPERTTKDTYGETMKPAVVYVPGGTYLISSTLDLYAGTVIVGDPLNPPVFKVASTFSGTKLISGRDSTWGSATQVFYIGLKNVVIDSTGFDKDSNFILVYWAVSQATQLQNIVFNMPKNSASSGHRGVQMGKTDYNSNIIINDLTFNGGYEGMHLNGQQWVFKGLTFTSCTTAVNIVSCTDCVFLGTSVSTVGTGFSAYGVSGSLIIMDSTVKKSGPLVLGTSGYKGYQSIILENVMSDDENKVTVKLDDNASAVVGSVADTWVLGQTYKSNDPTPGRGGNVRTQRAEVLLQNARFFTKTQPTFQEYSVDQVLNVKSVSGLAVYGDGQTDDTANINAILKKYAGCKVIHFPAGTYIVTDTILVPPGSRIHGDAYGSVISATGGRFYNPNSPTNAVQIGNAGDVGVAHVVDMMFSVADVLQGCKILEVNMAGSQPGDVGLWNTHIRVGGAAGSKVQDNCNGSPYSCKAAWGMVHLTSTSSAYIENMWGWTADHNLDTGGSPTISVARGMLIEATKGTWLVGTGFEHNTLYQYNFYQAEDVFTAMQQTETPYFQGYNEDVLAPAPWADNLVASDPTFSNCGSDDTSCRMAWMEHISNSSNLSYTQNAINVDKESSAVYLYGTNVHWVTNMFLSDYTVIATEKTNEGGWGGVVAAYQFDASAPNNGKTVVARALDHERIIVLAFLNNFGNGQTPDGNFGNECYIDNSGNGDCGQLANDINTCHDAGVKIILSIGGAEGTYGLSGNGDATGVAYSLWNEWARPNGVDPSAPRPIGDSYVDGWDLDIEKNPNGSSQYLDELVTALRSHFASDPDHHYYVTGASECPIPEPCMGDAITKSQLDYIFIQFYNNDYCSAYQEFRKDTDGGFNYDDWVDYIRGTPSQDAKLFIGLPAFKLGSTDDDSGSKYYIRSSELPTLLNEYKTHNNFGGVMLWDAGYSDSVNFNGCNYVQEVGRVMATGAGC
ncbi:hypothetical protein M436DRAFT_80126 [Aureobasidium namibiae CBS 147.97]|uniref:GH18 domain-containing protein n=1 Tax=Aureobasidium namibiae CBS 147.97 TaxID=1043004 RepID=A0A074XJD3_9PEZI